MHSLLRPAVLVYLNSLHGEFLYDDGYSVENNADVDAAKTPLVSLFRNNMWGEPFDKKFASHEVGAGGCGGSGYFRFKIFAK